MALSHHSVVVLKAVIVLAIVWPSAQKFYSDETACVGTRTVIVQTTAEADPTVKVHFECDKEGADAKITKCVLPDLADFLLPGEPTKTIALPSGNKYRVSCSATLGASVIEHFASRICKDKAPQLMVEVEETKEKLKVTFACDEAKNNIQTCFPPGGPKKGFPATESKQLFGGKSGRKYAISCSPIFKPVIRESYAGERCASAQDKQFTDNFKVAGLINDVIVTFRCSDADEISVCKSAGAGEVPASFARTFAFHDKNGIKQVFLACNANAQPKIEQVR